MKLLDLPGALGAQAARLVPIARRFWLPLLVGLSVGGVAIWLHESLAYRENLNIYRIMQAEAARLSSEASGRVTARIAALRTMASRWEKMRRPDRAEWEADASRLVSRDIQYRGVEWREPTLDLRWSGPFAARLPGAALDPRDDELRRRALEAMKDRPEPSISGTVLLTDGKRQLVVCAPMFAEDRGIGFQVGVLRLGDLMDALLSETIARGYSVAVYEDPFLIFGPAWLASGDDAALAGDAEFRIDDFSWRLKVWPGEELVKRMRTHDKDVVLVFGLVLAFFSAIMVDQLQLWRRRALAAETSGTGAAEREGSEPGGEPESRRDAEGESEASEAEAEAAQPVVEPSEARALSEPG